MQYLNKYDYYYHIDFNRVSSFDINKFYLYPSKSNVWKGFLCKEHDIGDVYYKLFERYFESEGN